MWGKNSSQTKRKKVAIKTNVLTLMITAYIAVFLMFALMVWGTENLDATVAWDMLESPLMALLGGTLAISKDLIRDDDDPLPGKNKEAQGNQPEHDNDQ